SKTRRFTSLWLIPRTRSCLGGPAVKAGSFQESTSFVDEQPASRARPADSASARKGWEKERRRDMGTSIGNEPPDDGLSFPAGEVPLGTAAYPSGACSTRARTDSSSRPKAAL